MKKSELKEFIKSSLLREDEDSKKGNKEEQERMEGAIRDDRDHIKDLEKDIKDNEDKLAKLKKDFKDDVNETTINEFGDGKDYNEMMRDISNKMRTLPSEDHEDFLTKLGKFIEAKKSSLNEQEEEDVNVDVEDEENVDVDVEKDVNVDVEDEVDVDDESVESDIEVKTMVPGESADVEAVQGLLTKAQQQAEKLGDEKLLSQIGNTITYFTRAHVVKVAEDVNEIELDVTGGEDNEAEVLDAESKLNLQEVKRFKKLAGLI
jgi:hypothetical protein